MGCSWQNFISSFIILVGLQRTLSTTDAAFYNAPHSVAATWHLLMQFCLQNHLPYSAMSKLLQLMDVILPHEYNRVPKSLHCFKKEYAAVVTEKWKFCAKCLTEIPAENKGCSEPLCELDDCGVCWYMNVPFTTHLEQICQGTRTYQKQTNVSFPIITILII